MKKLFPILAVALFSCTSFKPMYLDLSMGMPAGEGAGRVSRVQREERQLRIEDDENRLAVDIRFTEAVPEKVQKAIGKSTEYRFRSHVRPDGPVESLRLSDGTGMIAYLGDGLRPGALPGLELEFHPVAGDDQAMEIRSAAGEWPLRTGKIQTIQWEGHSYDAYLLNIRKGINIDQPAFWFDVLLIRQ